LNARDIQIAIYNYRHRIQSFPLIIPNVYLWSWESDILFITPSGFPHEFEIKISYADFKADGNKKRKHERLSDNHVCHRPATFTYVCPPDIIPVTAIPDYAGLAYVIEVGKYYKNDPDKCLGLKIIKTPKRRKIKALTEKQWRSIAGKIADRYWSLKRHYDQDIAIQEKLILNRRDYEY